MTSFKHTLRPSLVLASALLTACGGGGGSSVGGSAQPPRAVERYALVTSFNGDTLASYAVEAGTGRMRVVDTRPSILDGVAVLMRPGTHQVLALSAIGIVHQYDLSDRGILSPIDMEMPGGNNLSDLAVHPSGNYVYASDTGDNGIYQMTFDENGMLTPITPQNLAEPDYIGATFTNLVMHRNGKHLYAADLSSDAIAHFAINPDGSLDYVGNVDAGDGPYRMAMHPSANYLYAANRLDGSLSQYRIRANGTLEALAPPLAVGGQLEGVTLDASGRYLYASDLSGDKVWQFRITGNGTVTPLTPDAIAVASDIAPRNLVASPASARLYLSDSSSATMLAFDIGSNGTLTAASPDRLALDSYATDMTFTVGAPLRSSPRAAYVINGSDDDISQFLLDGDGTLSGIGDSNAATGASPSAITAHPSGKYLYVANFSDDTISQFRRSTVPAEIDTLKAIGPAQGTEAEPVALAVHPSGNYLYALSQAQNNVTLFSIASNGAISLVDSYQLAHPNPSALAIDPTGRFLWVVNNQASGMLMLMRIDPTDGTLTADGSATRSAGSNPRAVTVDASGTRLYVVASTSNQVRRYDIDADGVPAYVDAVVADSGMLSMQMSHDGNALYVVNGIAASVSQFNLADDGSLDAMIPATVSSGSGAHGIALDPSGKHLLVSNSAEASVTRFSIGMQGALTVQEQVPVGINPLGVAIVGYTE